MGTTGLIYVAIVAAWAAYLVPMWLRRHDEVHRPPVVGQYSEDLRVLSRRTDSLDRARYVARPNRVVTPPPKRSAAELRARRVAAMRRRRVFTMLTLSLLSVTALAIFSIVPRWAVAIPTAAMGVFFVAARLAVRRANATVMPEQTRETVVPEPVVTAPVPVVTAEPEPEVERDENLWDPVPVTLPTYVYKEKATRTVRTVNLSEADVFSSAPEPLLDESVQLEAPVEPEGEQIARAVGD